MYIADPTHGAGTRPNRTQPPTAARKTTLNAGQCVRQPREGRGRNRQAPPQKIRKKKGGGRENSRQPPKRPPTPQEAAKTPPPERHRGQDPQRGTGGPPSQNGQHQARNSGPPEERDTETCRHTPRKKKEPAAQPEKKGMGGQGPQSKQETKAQKTHPDNPAKKGGAQPRPGPSTHTHIAHLNQKARGASRARTKPHTSYKQAET